ncbi:membrane-targeted effector domain-containing toxin [Pseudomonas sp. RIT-To-2]|uniref:membrane-targeted effector domain-containing toxin n=1 Tax=Pseudomonas sp. RIT-To-2 TaxID=3462541 RepID=UPI002413B55D
MSETTTSQTAEMTLASLKQAATDFYSTFPDITHCARQEAARLLKAHTGQDLDPDAVYWHRFSNAISNTHTFTGWEHYGVPDKTLTMTELTLRRFDLSDQINAIDLDSMSGFYTRDGSGGFYDQRNEVALSPLTIMNALWEANFAQAYQTRLDAFWSAQEEQGRLVAKALCVSHAFQAMRLKVLTHRAFKQFMYTVSGPARMPPTILDLRRRFSTATLASVHDFTLGAHAATDIVRVQNAQGQQTLFLPPAWFRTFHSEQEVYDWVCTEAADPDRRQQLISHFGVHHQTDTSVLDDVNTTLDTMLTTPWATGQKLLNGASRLIKEDVFTYLIKNLRTRLETEAKAMLTTNWDLRKKLFLVDLSAFVRVTAGLAPGDSLVAGAVVGASAISLGAHTAVALHGSSHEERSQAAVAAAFDALSLLFSLPMLKGTGKHVLDEFVDLAEETPALLDTNTPLEYAVDIDVSQLPTEISGDGGLFYLSDNKRYIRLNSKTFEVEFIEVLDRWVVINPQAPDNLVGAWPVEPNWRGVWEPFTEQVFDPQDLEADATLSPARVSPQLAMAHQLNAQLRPYETPMKYVELTATLIGRDSQRLMTMPLDDTFAFARLELLKARNELATHARTFFDLPRATRSVAIPGLTPATTPDALFEAVYNNGSGMVIGEARDAIGSKKLLIKYMANLRSLGVETLYTDLLIKELHQGWVDHYLATGLMPADLYKYLHHLTEQSVLAKYTPLELIRSARRQGIKVKALDCAAAHQVHGLTLQEADIGQKMRNFYALQRIKAHQTARPGSGWIALVDHTRVGTFMDVPGLSELTDTVGLRVKDVPLDTPLAISDDLGQRLAGNAGTVRADLKIEIATQPAPATHSTSEV